jgi:hypothetical protein
MNPFNNGWTKEEVEEVIERNQPWELLYVPIVVAMNPPDCEWAQDICVKLSSHSDYNVRGNAILGFGHLARICGVLNEEVVKPVIESGLHDEEQYVREQAVAAAGDVVFYLGWILALL